MKKHIIKTVVLVFGIALFISNSSFGQQGNKDDRKEPPTFEQLLKEMDKNEDGKLSKKEIKGPLKKHFAKVDIDEDGFITEKEFEKAPKPKRGGRKENK
nr:EF-hand domain-containing protein [uncultured Psychroserpens sp.]